MVNMIKPMRLLRPAVRKGVSAVSMDMKKRRAMQKQEISRMMAKIATAAIRAGAATVSTNSAASRAFVMAIAIRAKISISLL